MYFELNEKPALDPAPILQGLKLRRCVEPWWFYKVNSFRQVRGVYPASGYLLMERETFYSIGEPTTGQEGPGPKLLQVSLKIAQTDENFSSRSIEYTNLLIKRSELIPTVSDPTPQSPCVVELTDKRAYLFMEKYNGDFNVIARSTQGLGTEYAAYSIDEEPWTWQEIIDELWGAAYEPIGTLVHDFEYPDIKPSNYFFRNLTPGEALAKVFYDLGLTLWYEQGTDTYHIVRYGKQDSNYNLFNGAGSPTVGQNTLYQHFLDGMIETQQMEPGIISHIPNSLSFVFPNRSYEDSSEVSAVDRFNAKPTFSITKTLISECSYAPLGNHSLTIYSNPVAIHDTAPSTNDPDNKFELDYFIDKVKQNIYRRIASLYGPSYFFAGLLNYYRPDDIIGAVTFYQVCSSLGVLSRPVTLIEATETRTSPFSPRENDGKLPDTVLANFPHHRSIIVELDAELSDAAFTTATVIDHRWNSLTPTAAEVVASGLRDLVVNLTGDTLKAGKYTADFHWQLQMFAIWPGASTAENNGGNTSTSGREPFRFVLLEDMTLDETTALAQLIDHLDRPINEKRQLVPTGLGTPPGAWQGLTHVDAGVLKISPVTIHDPLPPGTTILWNAGDVIRSKESRTTLAVFTDLEAAYWEKATDGGNGQVLVVDREKKRYGYKEYDDPQFGEQLGYTGTCFFLTDNYENDTPGYQIQDMEHEARWIEGIKIPDSEDETSFFMTVTHYWGNAPNGRPPKTQEIINGSGSQTETYFGIHVVCRLDEILPEDDDKVRAELDERIPEYVNATPPSIKFDYVVLELELEP